MAQGGPRALPSQQEAPFAEVPIAAKAGLSACCADVMTFSAVPLRTNKRPLRAEQRATQANLAPIRADAEPIRTGVAPLGADIAPHSAGLKPLGAAGSGGPLAWERVGDSHCHLLATSEAELKAGLRSYVHSPVPHFCLYSITLENAKRLAAALSALSFEEQARFSLGLGLHPWYLKPASFERELVGLLALYDELACSLPQILSPCWGEVGLDSKRADGVPLGVQQALLSEFIAVTKERCGAYSLHCVGAQSELLSVLKVHQVTGIVHGFSGKLGAAVQLVQRGLKLGLGPSVLRPEQEAKWRALLCDSRLAACWCLESDWDHGPYDSTLLARIAQRVDRLQAAR